MLKRSALLVAFVVSSALLTGMQEVKAEGTSYDDLLQRIEALEAEDTGNVTAPKIRGIKIGGHIRHRFEIQDQFGGKGDYTEDFTLQRVRLFFDLDVNKNVRGYIKFQDVRTWGYEGGTVGNLERVDLLEGFAELRNLGDLSSCLSNVELRIGRWQWWYGNHRLIGHLNWANEGRSYDGIRLKWDNGKNAWIHLFAASINETDTGGVSGDDMTGAQDEVLWGFYSQFKVAPGILVEPYMINRYRSRDQAGPAEGGGTVPIAGEERYTIGARIAGKKIPWLPGVDITLEQAYQFGDTEPVTGTYAGRDMDISAFAGAWGAGYTFNVAWSPRIGYDFVFAEGDDDPTDGDADTFSQIYPTGHARLGYIDFHGWQNIQDHQIHFSVKPTKKLLVKADFHFFDADEEADSWYNVGGGKNLTSAKLTTAGASTSDDYGEELDITAKYQLFKNFGVTVGYSHYWVGDAIEDFRASDDTDADWFYLQTVLKF